MALLLKWRSSSVRGMKEQVKEELGVCLDRVDPAFGKKAIEIVVHLLCILGSNNVELAPGNARMACHTAMWLTLGCRFLTSLVKAFMPMGKPSGVASKSCQARLNCVSPCERLCQLSSIIKFVILMLFELRESRAVCILSAVKAWPKPFQVHCSRAQGTHNLASMVHDSRIRHFEAVCHCDKHSTRSRLCPVISRFDDNVTLRVVKECSHHIIDATDSETDDMHAVAAEEGEQHSVLVQLELREQSCPCNAKLDRPGESSVSGSIDEQNIRVLPCWGQGQLTPVEVAVVVVPETDLRLLIRVCRCLLVYQRWVRGFQQHSELDRMLVAGNTCCLAERWMASYLDVHVVLVELFWIESWFLLLGWLLLWDVCVAVWKGQRLWTDDLLLEDVIVRYCFLDRPKAHLSREPWSWRSTVRRLDVLD
ncbi:hypothetical protein KC360_g100 [Hortaea werneckii]|nr:hypothetical protein KC360_g100 [Hortaea werneckii]